MLRLYDSWDLSELQAFENVEPWHEPALDFWAAQVCHLIDCLIRGEDARPPDKFLPEFLQEGLK